MGALNSYGAQNLVITKDYSLRFNEIIASEPELYIKIQPSDSEKQNVVEITTWYRGESVETAGWKYVGMDYTAAQSCANAMRQLLTYFAYEWEYGIHLENGSVVLGWYKTSASTYVMDSDVVVVKDDEGGLFTVEVQAHMSNVGYSKTLGINVAGSRPLADVLHSLDGWNTSTNPTNGRYFSSASASNIRIVNAPSYTREWEIVGVDESIVVPDGQSITGYSFPIWYKVRTTYQCQVKYVGMTRAACQNLYNSLNGSSGWWYAYHPWVYQAVASGGTVSFNWVQNTSTTLYQCLNSFTAYPVGGHLWEAELTLTKWDESYTTTPSSSFTPSYPSEWARVPGLSNYL